MSNSDSGFDPDDFDARERAETRERHRQSKNFDNKFVCYPCLANNKLVCKKRCFCYLCGTSYKPCECDSCIKLKFPCEHKKFPCNCNICKRVPDSEAIPKTLPIFRRLDLWVGYKYQTNHFYYPETAKFSNSLRSEIIGGSAIATHYAQDRFSDSHLKNLGVDKNLKTEFDSSGLLPNFNGNLKAWEQHKTITKAVNKFRKKYHRFPPCFRERMDIRSITKVNFIQKIIILLKYIFSKI